MKIIKNGMEKIFITQCINCKSDLEYMLTDIISKDRMFDND